MTIDGLRAEYDDGFGLVRELRADPRTRTTPVILLSARAGEEASAEARESRGFRTSAAKRRAYNAMMTYLNKWIRQTEDNVELKDDIHPNYVESRVICSCGETFLTRSTIPEIKVEVCSACHPFYTGKQKLVDTAGRVERFNKKYRRPEKTK